MSKGLYYFTHDLRVYDNAALSTLWQSECFVDHIYIVSPRDFLPLNFTCQMMGVHRWQFVAQAIKQLNQTLQQYGHTLWIAVGEPFEILTQLIQQQQYDTIGLTAPIGWFEQQTLAKLAATLPKLRIQSLTTERLFAPADLPLDDLTQLSFSQFRRKIERAQVEPWLPDVTLPRAPDKAHERCPDYLPLTTVKAFAQLSHNENITDQILKPPLFRGGEQDAREHLERYFSTTSPQTYKQTRNALSGWQNSTKFSPYLAHGNVSVRQVWQYLKHYEQYEGANESTYWIGLELLWREYFHILAAQIGSKLYSLAGLTTRPAPKTNDLDAFQRWCNANTGYELVDACMQELNKTGYLSNRGRQIVASCLIHELDCDWRYGAAYFQQQLIDFDVAVNWGNWQYIAGVGTDPRGGRHFNIAKQTELYDPDGVYRQTWLSDTPDCL